MDINSVSVKYLPARGFCTWLITDIWLGPDGDLTKVIVPNVNDMVIDWSVPCVYRVIHVDADGSNPTYTPTLVAMDLSAGANSQLAFKKLDSYQPNILERIFLDRSALPYTFSVDDRYAVYGSEATTCKLFKGTDVSDLHGTVISQRYNGSGQLIGENIDLENIALDPNNSSIKRPVQFNTGSVLNDGEIVTLVIYSQSGMVMGKHPFIVENSTAIRRIERNQVAIVDVVLLSNMLDSVEQDLLKVPAETAITGADFQAQLIYSNGETVNIAIDGIKCCILGLNNFNTSSIGTTNEFVLAYYPNPDEAIINSTNPDLKHVSHIYRVRTVENVLDYAFRIYIVPKYNAQTDRYVNKYYLTNVLYDMMVELTPEQIRVELVSGGVIDYTRFSEWQHLKLIVRLSDVFPYSYPGYTFIQQVKINYGQTGLNYNPWVIDYLGDNTGVYGVNTRFAYSNLGLFALDLKMGLLTPEQWLAKIWEPLHAIFDPITKLIAPVPTHFKLRYQGITTDAVNLSDFWDVNVGNINHIHWDQYDTVEVIWLLETPGESQYRILGISPVMIDNTLV